MSRRVPRVFVYNNISTGFFFFVFIIRHFFYRPLFKSPSPWTSKSAYARSDTLNECIFFFFIHSQPCPVRPSFSSGRTIYAISECVLYSVRTYEIIHDNNVKIGRTGFLENVKHRKKKKKTSNKICPVVKIAETRPDNVCISFVLSGYVFRYLSEFGL